MAYSMMTAAELLALKAAIKKEMLRRNAPIGGLDAYGGATYDFSVTPVRGGVVKAGIGKKTVPESRKHIRGGHRIYRR